MRKSRKDNGDESHFDQSMEQQEFLAKRIGKRMRNSGYRMAVFLLFAVITSAIAFNAVVLQPARHPAPLFAAVDAARAVEQKPAPVVKSPMNAMRTAHETVNAKPVEEKPQLKAERAPAERMAEKNERPADKIEKIIEKTDKPAVKNPAMASHAPAQQKNAPRSSSGDALGEFIRAGIVPPASIPNEPDARVMAIQKNLQRLGYAVGKPDGMMGSGTRAAIEKFERDRKWAVSGEVTQRLMRELGTVSAGKRD